MNLNAFTAASCPNVITLSVLVVVIYCVPSNTGCEPPWNAYEGVFNSPRMVIFFFSRYHSIILLLLSLHELCSPNKVRNERHNSGEVSRVHFITEVLLRFICTSNYLLVATLSVGNG